MPPKFLILLAVVAISGVTVGVLSQPLLPAGLFGRQANASTPLLPQPKSIQSCTRSTPPGSRPMAYILGDSNTVAMDFYGLQGQFPRSWNAQVRGRKGRTIFNNSRPSGYEQAVLDTHIIARAKVVIIALGVNREHGGDSVNIAPAMIKLLRHVKAAMCADARLYWVSLYDRGKAQYIARRNETIRRLSTTPGYEFTIIPWYTKVAENPGWLRDPLHLTPEGNRLMGQYIVNFVT